MTEQTNKIKNWIIGILVVIILLFGYSLLNKNNTRLLPETERPPDQITQPTQTQNKCLTAQETWTHIGETTCVEFTVESPYQSSKGNVFLNEKQNYKTGFTVFIPSASVRNFNGNPVSLYGYKTIRVTGLLRTYQGHPEIIVNSPSQIVVIK
jgi:DNA/RNA endonuclease YhcR with UshA esterase domain